MADKIYLDYAAAAPLAPEVLSAMKPYLEGYFHNPSAIYLDGRAARLELEKARQEIAGSLGAKKPEIILTAGATEANNLAIQGVMRAYPEAEVVVSDIEHESVLEPAGLFNRRHLPVTSGGIVSMDVLPSLLKGNTVLLSTMMVSNELGTVQPLKEIARIVDAERTSRVNNGSKLPLFFHTDAAQAGNCFDLHVSRLGVDMMSLNGGKIYGPKQSGALFVKSGVSLSPLILGGGQERALRSGTESLASAAGLAHALSLAQKGYSEERIRLSQLKGVFATELQKSIPQSVINGSSKHVSPHILSLTLPGTDSERLLMELDEAGVQVGLGSACSASSDKPSKVLSAIGLKSRDIGSTLRFSFGRQTTIKDIKAAVNTLVRLAG